MGRTVLTAVLPAIALVSLTAAPAMAERNPSGNRGNGQVDSPGQLVQLQLLGFNDYHGHVLPEAAGRAAGLSAGFSYDLSRTIVNSTCTAVAISNATLNGVPLDLAATYNVTVNNFLAAGGDNFGAFSPVAPPGTDRVNELN
jgi:2',3'-cyclic-nucleotide 2'-phosphodiesterase (5'-nucleotidase family)